MDVVTFHGRSYVKATVLASRYRYSTDYLGQLARGKKVDARLIGRAWYINEDSLLEHRKGRYKITEAEISDEKASNNYLSRVTVEPYVKSKTARLVLGRDGSAASTKVSYQADDQSLIPSVKKIPPQTRVPVEIADAEVVKIVSEKSKFTHFEPESLPEVYLKGTVKIKDISDEEEVETESLAKPAPTIELPVEKPVEARVLAPRTRKAVTLRRPVRNVVSHIPKQPMQRPIILAQPAPVPRSFSPRYLEKSVPPKTPSFKYPLLALLLGLFVGLILLATTSDLLVTMTETVPVWEISIENLRQLLP